MTKRGSGPIQREQDWNFYSFPTACGVAGGMLLFALLLFLIPYPLLLLATLSLCSFCVAHAVFTGRRIRSERTKRSRAEEAEIERRILAQRADTEGSSSRRAIRRRRGT